LVFATRANLDSDHDRSRVGAAVDTVGKRLHAAFYTTSRDAAPDHIVLSALKASKGTEPAF
jgi:hypothetical protein